MNETKLLSHDDFSVSEISDPLNISPFKAYELAHPKAFPVCCFGGSIRVPKEPFPAWIVKMTDLPGGLMPGA